MRMRSFEKLSSECEADETFIGGKVWNMHRHCKRKINAMNDGNYGKAAVLGLLQREGHVRAMVAPNRKTRHIRADVLENVELGSALYTDEAPGGGARSSACGGARVRGEVGERLSSWREARDWCEQRDTAYDDGLLTEGKEYRRCGGRVSWRGRVLAIDLEGTGVCDWLTPKEITCVLLKYGCGPVSEIGTISGITDGVGGCAESTGASAVHAAEWDIDPHKIGMLGFSAGGHLSAISAH